MAAVLESCGTGITVVVAENMLDDCQSFGAPGSAGVQHKGEKTLARVTSVLGALTSLDGARGARGGLVEHAVDHGDVDVDCAQCRVREDDVENGLIVGGAPVSDDLLHADGTALALEPRRQGVTDGVVSSEDAAAKRTCTCVVTTVMGAGCAAHTSARRAVSARDHARDRVGVMEPKTHGRLEVCVGQRRRVVQEEGARGLTGGHVEGQRI